MWYLAPLIIGWSGGVPIINAPPDNLLKFHGSLFLGHWGQPNSLVMPSLKFHVLTRRHWDNRDTP